MLPDKLWIWLAEDDGLISKVNTVTGKENIAKATGANFDNNKSEITDHDIAAIRKGQ